MGSPVRQEQRGEIFGTDWKDKLLKAITEKITDELLEICFYRMPFGYYKHLKRFGKIEFKFLRTHNPNKYQKLVDFMSIFVWRTNNNDTVVGLKQSFYGTVPPQTFVKFKEDFHYKWDNDNKIVTIKRNIGSLSDAVLENQIEILLNECWQFSFLYCPEHKNLKKLV